MTTQLHVKGLPYSFSSQQLREAFERYGEVADAVIRKTATPSKKPDKINHAYGCVTFKDSDAAAVALVEASKVDFGVGEVHIELARSSKSTSMEKAVAPMLAAVSLDASVPSTVRPPSLDYLAMGSPVQRPISLPILGQKSPQFKSLSAQMPMCSFGQDGSQRIELIDVGVDCTAACMELRRTGELNGRVVLGFDTESKPSFVKGQRSPICLIQLASLTLAVLFRLRRSGAVSVPQLPPALRALLEDENVILVGQDIMKELPKLLPKPHVHPTSVFELSVATRATGCLCGGMMGYGAAFLGVRLSKSKQVQLSNWEAPTLTPQQMQYAATDAWACRAVYDVLQSPEAYHLCRQARPSFFYQVRGETAAPPLPQPPQPPPPPPPLPPLLPAAACADGAVRLTWPATPVDCAAEKALHFSFSAMSSEALSEAYATAALPRHDGLTDEQAANLLRHTLRDRIGRAAFDQLMGDPVGAKDVAVLFERIVETYLRSHGVRLRTEEEQKLGWVARRAARRASSGMVFAQEGAEAFCRTEAQTKGGKPFFSGPCFECGGICKVPFKPKASLNPRRAPKCISCLRERPLDTPDFVFEEGALEINGAAVGWLDCKCFYGNVSSPYTLSSITEQAGRFHRAHGSGAILFAFGFCDELRIEHTLLLDATPLDLTELRAAIR